jgi:hypothetical protein
MAQNNKSVQSLRNYRTRLAKRRDRWMEKGSGKELINHNMGGE